MQVRMLVKVCVVLQVLILLRAVQRHYFFVSFFIQDSLLEDPLYSMETLASCLFLHCWSNRRKAVLHVALHLW